MWCVIPVAGKGTRLLPLTRNIPKPLIKIGGRTIIEHLLDNILPSISKICIITNHMDYHVQNVIGDEFFSIPVRYAEQKMPLGLADAVLQAKEYVRGTFILVMGDSYYAASLSSYIRDWQRSGTDGAILVQNVIYPVTENIGMVRVRGNRIVEIKKGIPEINESYLRICGLMILPEAIFELCKEVQVSGNNEFEIETAVQALVDEGAELIPLHYKGWRKNINTIKDLDDVRRKRF